MTDRETKQQAASVDQKALQGYAIGTAGRPFPMVRKFTNEEGRVEQELGVLEDSNNPLMVHSELDYASMIGRAYRDMPTPGMLRLFLNGMRQREVVECPTVENPHGYKPVDPRRVEFMMGDPGAGKSFLANLHAKMRDKRGAILVDCGGRNLNELLYETVLDYSAGQTIFEEIDQRLQSGQLNPATKAILRDKLGAAYSEDEHGRASIDWSEVGVARYDTEEVGKRTKAIADELGVKPEDLAKSLEDLEKDPALLAKVNEYNTRVEGLTAPLLEGAEQARDDRIAAIKEVANLEGLGKGGNASIGLTVKEGPIIRAWREGRPLILDEYNKAKPGTDDALQILWQVFNGEMESHTVKGGGGKTFTFDKNQMPPNFFVTLTGNLTKDGYSTRSLSASAYQRLQPQYIEAPTVEDWQHRICQKLTGMPVSTIYHANEKYWKEHKDEFTDFLVGMRKRGLSEEQQANIPSWQFEMLNNWDRVLQASNQLAEFYDKWAQAVDPDSKLYKEAEKGTNTKVLELQEEIDNAFRDEAGIGLRRMLRHTDQAVIVNAEPIESRLSKGFDAAEDFDQAPDVSQAIPEEVEKRYGTRLSNVILEDLSALTHGRDRLMDYLLVRAAEAGLFEMVLEEGKTTGDRLLSNLLDIDPELSKQVPENIERTHSLLCDYLRQKFNGVDDIEFSEDNFDIISPSKLEHVLTNLSQRRDVERASVRSGVLYLPNEDLETASDIPLVPTVSTDMPLAEQDVDYLPKERQDTYAQIRAEEEGLQGVEKLPVSELVDASRLLVGFALPNVGTQNLKALWSEYSIDCEELTSDQSAQQIAINQSPSGIATQLIQCKTKDANGNEQSEYLYVLHDDFSNKTLITGTQEISPALQDALEKNSVAYVNRKQPDAEAKIQEALKDVFDGKTDISDANMPIERTAILAFSQRVTWDINRRVKGEDGRIRPVHEQFFTLPHHELVHPNYSSQIITDEERAKDSENLVALLSDRGDYLEKSEKLNTPFIATESPDLEQLKHTVRHLTESSQQKAAGKGA